MKVILVNGSPKKEGSTYLALQEIEKTLIEESIEAQIFHIGKNIVSSCQGCGMCEKLKKCKINDDSVNEFLELAKSADGFIFATPVHYASPSGNLVSFMDRVFFAAARSGLEIFEHKPTSSVAIARRAGTTAALEVINKYFTITQMPIISGRYWNNVFAQKPYEVIEDKEGLQNMRILARNLAWHLKAHKIAKDQGLELPKKEETVYTNFTR